MEMASHWEWIENTYPIVSDDEREWIGISGSHAEVSVYRYDGVTGSSWDHTPIWKGNVGLEKRFVVCEFCNVRNPNDDKTFYCVSCGGPLPI